MQQHAQSFFAQSAEAGGARLPQFVRDEFDAFLACGILAHGFLRLRCGQCGHDKLLAFSCKRRGFCPSCGARRMAQTAAHLVDHVIPRVPVRQWVLSLPIPLRLLLKMLTRRGVLIEEMGQTWLAEPDADGDDARTLRPLQAVAITYRIAFGPRAGQKVLTLRGALARFGLARELLCSDIDGFSLHAAVRVQAHERKRLEQLCRYITRPALADERVQLNAAGQVELKLKTPWRDGTTHLVMSPLEFMQRLAALVPRPRLHLIRFHGVLAPNAKLRSLVVPQGPPKDEEVPGVAASGAQCEAETAQGGPARISWARLLKRVFDIDLQRCPNCGAGELKIIAAILERAVIEKILSHLGLDPQPPPKGRVREAGLHFAA